MPVQIILKSDAGTYLFIPAASLPRCRNLTGSPATSGRVVGGGHPLSVPADDEIQLRQDARHNAADPLAGAIINENIAGFHGETNSAQQERDHE